MATTAAWNNRYVPILRDTLGLRVEVHPDHLRVLTGSGLHYRLSTDPDTTPHSLDIAFHISLRPHTELLNSHPQLLTDIATRLTASTPLVKVLPTGDTRCVLLIQTALAIPGTLPEPHLLTALLPVHLDTLAEAFHDLHTELEAAALYTA